MKKTERLFELMLILNRKRRFTVQELADELAVSKRTMIRDLHALSEMGVPLVSMPGLHGGYEVMNSQSLPHISLSPDEAVGMILSYEALNAYTETPFRESQLSALTKLKSALTPDLLEEVDHLRRYMTIDVERRNYQAPLLKEILHAATDGVHLEIEYESYSGRSKRIVFPYGLVASQGYWYCPSFYYKRNEIAWFRADRIMSIKRLDDYQAEPKRTTLTEIIKRDDAPKGSGLKVEARLTKVGREFAEWHPQLFRHVHRNDDGTGVIEWEIDESGVKMLGNLLLSLGNQVEVVRPKEIRDYLREEALKIFNKYSE